MKNDFLGKKYGRLTIIRTPESKKTESNSGVTTRKYVLCRCECGNEKVISLTLVINGKTKSCGCLKKEVATKTFKKHGKRNCDEYRIWAAIKQRCLNVNSSSYKNYGGRGVRVCDEWINSFDIFFKDMGERPSKYHSIDRIDVMGDYCHSNCRWATDAEQARNRRTTKIISTPKGDMCIKDAAIEFGISPNTLNHRINKGSAIEEALKKPSRTRYYKGYRKN